MKSNSIRSFLYISIGIFTIFVVLKEVLRILGGTMTMRMLELKDAVGNQGMVIVGLVLFFGLAMLIFGVCEYGRLCDGLQMKAVKQSIVKTIIRLLIDLGFIVCAGLFTVFHNINILEYLFFGTLDVVFSTWVVLLMAVVILISELITLFSIKRTPKEKTEKAPKVKKEKPQKVKKEKKGKKDSKSLVVVDQSKDEEKPIHKANFW